MVETPLNLNPAAYGWSAAQGGPTTREAYVERLTRMSPAGMPWSQLEEIGRAAAYLAGPDTVNVTGTVLTVDIGANTIVNAV